MDERPPEEVQPQPEPDADASGAYQVPDDLGDLSPLAPLLKKAVDHMRKGNGHQKDTIDEMRLLRQGVMRTNRWLKVVVGLLFVGILVGGWVTIRLERTAAETNRIGRELGERLDVSPAEVKVAVEDAKKEMTEQTQKAIKDAASEPKAELVEDSRYPGRFKVKIPVAVPSSSTYPTSSARPSSVELPVHLPPVTELQPPSPSPSGLKK